MAPVTRYLKPMHINKHTVSVFETMTSNDRFKHGKLYSAGAKVCAFYS